MGDDHAITRSSGNVFADAGLPDADSQLVKAQLVSRIDDIICGHGLSQREAARILDACPTCCGAGSGAAPSNVSCALLTAIHTRQHRRGGGGPRGRDHSCGHRIRGRIVGGVCDRQTRRHPLTVLVIKRIGLAALVAATSP